MLPLKAMALALTVLAPAVTALAIDNNFDTVGNTTDFNTIDLGDDMSMDLEEDVSIDLADGTSLYKPLTPINVCAHRRAGYCSEMDDTRGFARYVAHIIKQMSNNHSCEQTIVNFGNWKIMYFATGRHCDTTAKEETMYGAIYKYLHLASEGLVCEYTCLRLTHGGTWKGYLQIAKDGWDDAHCDVQHYGGDGQICSSGGNNDI
ncbi:hypothetical protein BJX99DRAFT_259693 [Aspergillus californicus]